MTKKCTRCSLDKLEEEFGWKIKNKRRNSWCKECNRAYQKEHYKNNSHTYIKKAKVWKEKERILFYNWLATQKCVDCGISDIRVLECDHLGDKDFNIGSKIGTISLTVLMLEVEKCDIVCANCHKIRTAMRGNWYAYMPLKD